MSEVGLYGLDSRKEFDTRELYGMKKNTRGFGAYIEEAEKRNVRSAMTAEEMEEDFKRLDAELKQIREENKREQELKRELRIKKRRLQKKLMEKLALKKYLARQDEISQMNERISLEKMVGEDVYIEKAPLSKSLSIAEIMALCSENL